MKLNPILRKLHYASQQCAMQAQQRHQVPEQVNAIMVQVMAATTSADAACGRRLSLANRYRLYSAMRRLRRNYHALASVATQGHPHMTPTKTNDGHEVDE